jgi:hypothetical protein
MCTLVLGIHRYINTLSISSGVYVCKRAGVICFMMRRVTCYTLSSIARSINRFYILEIGMLMIVWERGGKKVAKKRFNFSINDEHCFCFIHIFLFHSFSFSFRSSRQRLFLSSSSSSFTLPSVLVLTFPYHRHRSIIFCSVYL